MSDEIDTIRTMLGLPTTLSLDECASELVDYNEPDRLELKEYVRELLSKVSPRERQVVTALFGLDGNERRTFREVAIELKVGVSTVENHYKRAMLKLRSLVVQS